MNYLLVSSVLFGTCSAEVLKIGGPIQSTGVGSYGKKAWELWKDWANSAANTNNFTVELHWGPSSDIAGVVKNMTNSSICSPACVDVLIGPYGSGGSITAIGAIHADFKGAVMVWGGASDSIFTTHCKDKAFKCYGTFTTASNYMTTGLNAIDAGYTKPLKAALFENANAFSASVCKGANSTINSLAGITVHSSTVLSEKSSVPEADMKKVEAVLAEKPDIVLLCGHNGFVEAITHKVQTTYSPTAILGTNTITSASQTKLKELGATAECVMMPTQWAAGATKDTIVGWDSAAFKAAMPAGQATYHAASAGGAGIALTHAMAAGTAGTRVGTLTTLLSGLAETPSFYGPIKFNNHGIISKPMYTQQHQGGVNHIVAPASAKAGDLKHPLSTCAGWPKSKSEAGGASPTPAPAAGGDSPTPAPASGSGGDSPTPAPAAGGDSSTPAPASGSGGAEADAAHGMQSSLFLVALAAAKIFA